MALVSPSRDSSLSSKHHNTPHQTTTRRRSSPSFNVAPGAAGAAAAAAGVLAGAGAGARYHHRPQKPVDSSSDYLPAILKDPSSVTASSSPSPSSPSSSLYLTRTHHLSPTTPTSIGQAHRLHDDDDDHHHHHRPYHYPNGTAAPPSLVAGTGSLSPPSLDRKEKKNNTWRASLLLHLQHPSSSASLSPSTSTPSSASSTPPPPPPKHLPSLPATASRATPDTSSPPVVWVDAVPTLSSRRIAYANSVTHRESPDASPLLGLGAADLSVGDRPSTAGSAAATSAHRNSPVQGLGLSVESRYSRWGPNIGASRSHDNLSIGSGRPSPRNSPLLSQGQFSPPGGRGGDWHTAADMSSRRRSISSANNQTPHEPYRNYDTDAALDRNRMSEFDSTDLPRARERREQDKKTMLSKALQKAHTAVLLDNAHNFEGAIEAYDDACRLLGQVLIRSAGEDDRRKLDAIRTTYTNRIQELHQINREAAQANGKNLPARPMSDESLSAHDTPHSHRSLEPEPRPESLPNGQSTANTRSSANTLASQQSVRTESSIASPPRTREPSPPPPPPPQQPAPPSPEGNNLPLRAQNPPTEMLQPATFKSTEQFLTIGSPLDLSYVPPPLSPRRMQQTETEAPANGQLQPPPAIDAAIGHSRGNSNTSMSWLDTIDESGGSSDGSSVRSLRNSALDRKHARMPSGDTEAEFDAALDAAVEAAYADGMEPYEYDDNPLDYGNTVLSEPVKQMVDTERKRLSDRSQIIQQAHARTKQLTKEGQLNSRQSRDLYRLSDDAEEERILEEIQKDFGFDFGLQSKSSMPRQSDSSEYSGASTYHSSMSSSKATASTSLSTVSETQDSASLSKPSQNLPRLSEESSQRDSLPMSPGSQFGGPLPGVSNGGVRSRRMSGQNSRQLKIETSILPKTKLPQPPPTAPPTTIRVEDVDSGKPLTAKSDTQVLLPDSIFQPPVPAPLTTPLQPPQTFVPQSSPLKIPDSPPSRDAIPTPTTPAVAPGLNGERSPGPDTKAAKDRPTMLKKNKSSISLKTRNISISSPDGSEVSVGTPLSTSFTSLSNNSKKNLAYTNSGVPPTPGLPSLSDGLSQSASNVNLFESDLHSPFVPGSPNPMAANAPIPLEPCPDSHLLRPYWLMRCFYQTIAHPRGGYLSTKLFVPRDVWRVKGVKIKAMEEKIANCDFLTAGLQKLNSVDSFDAAAVLEEMQQFEMVLDQVQNNLAKKLGNEVSVQGIQTLFKDAPISGEGISPSDVMSSASSSVGSSSSRAVSQGKSFLSSMRKLRSKNSAIGLTANPSLRDPTVKDSLTMSTLPMTNLANPRFAKRELAKLEVSGPHAQYMESLARLCDAVQVIDQVARQVEDPGLKHSSPTHVGLELSTRHASEFFGFYICRFVLTDLTMLLDKFIKRGSEWVLV